MELTIAELQKSAARLPKPGGRKVQIVNIVKCVNSVGMPILYVEYDYKGARWGLTYRYDDPKLKAVFPNGKIVQSDIGKFINVEIEYCNGKNGLYPSVLGLDPDEQ